MTGGEMTRTASPRTWIFVFIAGVIAAMHVWKFPGAMQFIRADLSLTLVEAGTLLGIVQVAAMLLGLAVLVALVLIVRLVMVGPGDEEDAFIPFIGLNAAVFPAIFAGVMGWLGGRALLRRAAA